MMGDFFTSSSGRRAAEPGREKKILLLAANLEAAEHRKLVG
jgi:hypothetical protein